MAAAAAEGAKAAAAASGAARTQPKLRDKEIEDYLNSFPLLAETLPAEGEESAAFAALKSLVDETPPEERAESFKESGNIAYKLGRARWRDAIVYYSQGIDEQCGNAKLNSQLHANRAQVLLQLGNFGKAVKDCLDALKFDRGNVKAYFRAAKASAALHRHEHVLAFCREGLEVPELKEEERAALRELQSKSEQALAREREAEARREARRQELARMRRGVADALAARRVQLETSPMELSEEVLRGSAQGGRLYVDEAGRLHFPVLFLYPEFETSDFVQDFCEDQTFAEHLRAMFDPSLPAPAWDPQRRYRPDALAVYVATKELVGLQRTRQVAVPLRSTLLQALQLEGHLVPQVPAFSVLARGSDAERSWLAREAES